MVIVSLLKDNSHKQTSTNTCTQIYDFIDIFFMNIQTQILEDLITITYAPFLNKLIKIDTVDDKKYLKINQTEQILTHELNKKVTWTMELLDDGATNVWDFSFHE